MKKLNITKEQFNRSNYFQKKYGKLEYVSESGNLFKTNKGKVLKFNESLDEDGSGRDYYGDDFFDDEINQSDYIVVVQDLLSDTGSFYGPYASKDEAIAKYDDILQSSEENGYKVDREGDSSFVIEDDVRIILIPGHGAN